MVARVRQRGRIVPVHEWPEEARNRWEEALRPGDILETERRVPSWKPLTKRNVASGYGAWLAWREMSNPDSNGSLRPAAEELADYVAYMQQHLAAATVKTRLTHLEIAIRLLDPDSDCKIYRTIRANLPEDDLSLEKRKRMQSASDLMSLGISLMDGVSLEVLREAKYLRQFRSGLQIALLAARPLRMKNFSSLRLGTHIRLIRNQWYILIEGHETKTDEPLEATFPKMLTAYLNHYLTEIRPRLLKAPTDALWLSQYGSQQSSKSIAYNIGRWTEAEFGRSLNPHLFRDCAATSIAVEDPQHINIIASVLGHASLATSQEYYNQARSIDASRRYLSCLQRLKRKRKSIKLALSRR